ncbi:unnamed protein product [Phytophthora lilii]|uniref:Unnamed protein product n=1 Tax=Phytophthora lilii TaxID=2077276 RepID=A0A9W6WJZ6_9STRA|nr:unnamed protein product [Phytophthora lilii]
MRVTHVNAGGGCALPADPPATLGAAVLRGHVGNFHRILETLPEDLQAAPTPRIVLLGHEGSGRSSLLASLALLSWFPRASDTSDRLKLPVILKLRHMSQSDVEVEGDPELMPHCGSPTPGTPPQQIKLRLVYSDGREPVASNSNLSQEQAAQLARQWMQQIVQDEQGQSKLSRVVDHELEIQVHSPEVTNLDLVDLPGIVAGRLDDEPDDMMQRTRAIAEKYLQMPDTFVLAVVPAFERVRNSQAFQLVQQYDLMDNTIGVLTMVDRAIDKTNPDGPLAEVTSRLEGTSCDVVELKEGYVVVLNRDTRSTAESTLSSVEEFKVEENAWLEENLPGYIDRGLASSSVLVKKIEKMLASHVREVWVPQTQANIDDERNKAEKQLRGLGPDPQQIVDDFVGVYPTAARKRMLQLVKPILPEILSMVDADMLQLAAHVHADFLQTREEQEFMLAPFLAKNQQLSFDSSSGSLVAASLLVLDSHGTYVTNHLTQILKNVVLHLVNLIQETIAASSMSEQKESSPQRLDRFENLHYFFAGVLWERLNELMIDEGELLHRLENSFLEFDPENSSMLHLPTKIANIPLKRVHELKSLACKLELYLDSKGFQNTSLDEIYLPQVPPMNARLTREMSRLIISAELPTLPKPHTQTVGRTHPRPESGRCFYSNDFTPNDFSPPSTIPASEHRQPNEDSQEVGEFEVRLFFAITSHVVAPLLRSIFDANDLARNMQEYVSCHPKVSESNDHLFYENEPEKRNKVIKLVERLNMASIRLCLAKDGLHTHASST